MLISVSSPCIWRPFSHRICFNLYIAVYDRNVTSTAAERKTRTPKIPFSFHLATTHLSPNPLFMWKLLPHSPHAVSPLSHFLSFLDHSHTIIRELCFRFCCVCDHLKPNVSRNVGSRRTVISLISQRCAEFNYQPGCVHIRIATLLLVLALHQVPADYLKIHCWHSLAPSRSETFSRRAAIHLPWALMEQLQRTTKKTIQWHYFGQCWNHS